MSRLLANVGIFFIIYLPVVAILFMLGLEVGTLVSNLQRLDGSNFVIPYLCFLIAVFGAVPSAILIQRFLLKKSARKA
jgi:hypothetical protein